MLWEASNPVVTVTLRWPNLGDVFEDSETTGLLLQMGQQIAHAELNVPSYPEPALQVNYARVKGATAPLWHFSISPLKPPVSEE